MSKYNYVVGIDVASGSDKSVVVICRQKNIRWYHYLLKKLGLRKHIATIEVVESYEVGK